MTDTTYSPQAAPVKPSAPAVGGFRVGFAMACSNLIMIQAFPYLSVQEQVAFTTPIVMFTTVVGKSVRKWTADHPPRHVATHLASDVFGGLL